MADNKEMIIEEALELAVKALNDMAWHYCTSLISDDFRRAADLLRPLGKPVERSQKGYLCNWCSQWFVEDTDYGNVIVQYYHRCPDVSSLMGRLAYLKKENPGLRARAEAAEKEVKALRTCVIDRGKELGVIEKERDELKAENEKLKAENLAMRNCDNCNVRLKTIYYDCPHRRDCSLGLKETEICFWQPRKAVKNG